ncbi:MAG TPA: hypothetical protein VFA74_06675 [Terriglobales bacterium]|nr:hypothetical protein [Terriglobales bacterium]
MLAALVVAIAPGGQATAPNANSAELVSSPSPHVAQFLDLTQPSDTNPNPFVVDGHTKP